MSDTPCVLAAVGVRGYWSVGKKCSLDLKRSVAVRRLRLHDPAQHQPVRWPQRDRSRVARSCRTWPRRPTRPGSLAPAARVSDAPSPPKRPCPLVAPTSHAEEMHATLSCFRSCSAAKPHLAGTPDHRSTAQGSGVQQEARAGHPWPPLVGGRSLARSLDPRCRGASRRVEAPNRGTVRRWNRGKGSKLFVIRLQPAQRLSSI